MPEQAAQAVEEHKSLNMKFEISSQKALRFLDLILSVNDEFRLEVTDEGWHVLAPDAAHICMIDATLAIRDFDKFEAPPGPAVLFLDAQQLRGTISRLSSLSTNERKASVTVNIGEKEGGMCEWMISCEGSSVIAVIRNDIGGLTEARKPNLPLLTERAFVEWSRLKRVLKVATGICDYFRLVHLGEALRVQCESNKGEGKFEATACHNIAGDEGCMSIYPADYAQALMKACSFDRVTLRFGSALPLVVQFDDGSIKGEYLLAPRTEA
jgi:hypothetical protein